MEQVSFESGGEAAIDGENGEGWGDENGVEMS